MHQSQMLFYIYTLFYHGLCICVLSSSELFSRLSDIILPEVSLYSISLAIPFFTIILDFYDSLNKYKKNSYDQVSIREFVSLYISILRYIIYLFIEVWAMLIHFLFIPISSSLLIYSSFHIPSFYTSVVFSFHGLYSYINWLSSLLCK